MSNHHQVMSNMCHRLPGPWEKFCSCYGEIFSGKRYKATFPCRSKAPRGSFLQLLCSPDCKLFDVDEDYDGKNELLGFTKDEARYMQLTLELLQALWTNDGLGAPFPKRKCRRLPNSPTEFKNWVKDVAEIYGAEHRTALENIRDPFERVWRHLVRWERDEAAAVACGAGDATFLSEMTPCDWMSVGAEWVDEKNPYLAKIGQLLWGLPLCPSHNLYDGLSWVERLVVHTLYGHGDARPGSIFSPLTFRGAVLIPESPLTTLLTFLPNFLSLSVAKFTGRYQPDQKPDELLNGSQPWLDLWGDILNCFVQPYLERRLSASVLRIKNSSLRWLLTLVLENLRYRINWGIYDEIAIEYAAKLAGSHNDKLALLVLVHLTSSYGMEEEAKKLVVRSLRNLGEETGLECFYQKKLFLDEEWIREGLAARASKVRKTVKTEVLHVEDGTSCHDTSVDSNNAVASVSYEESTSEAVMFLGRDLVSPDDDYVFCEPEDASYE